MEQGEGSGEAWSEYHVLAEKVAELIAYATPRPEGRESPQIEDRIPHLAHSFPDLPIHQLTDHYINLILEDLKMAVNGHGRYGVVHGAMQVRVYSLQGNVLNTADHLISLRTLQHATGSVPQ